MKATVAGADEILDQLAALTRYPGAIRRITAGVSDTV
jgi:hypothetical protein